MPTLEWNTQEWNTSYPWSDDGDEWSEVWGGSETQWAATLLPRVRNFLPASTILEIAPGHGRWTRYLVSLCDTYIGVDLAANCIAACQERFKAASHACFFVNDGRSLPMVPDSSVDFVFSFDSLVHVEAEVIKAYLAELARVMGPQGIGFLHHSNLGAHLTQLRLSQVLERTSRALPVAKRALRRWQIVEWDHARARTMTSKRFAELCRDAGLVCVGQEIVDWGPRTIDCLSLVTPPGSRWSRPNIVVMNPDFMSEAHSAGKVAGVYTSLRSRSKSPTRVAESSVSLSAEQVLSRRGIIGDPP